VQHRCLTGLVAILLLFNVALQGQYVEYENYSYRPDGNYLKSYWTVAKKIPSGPARWRAGEWIAFSGVVAGGIIVYAYDLDIFNWMQRNPTTAKDNISKYGFDPLGIGLYPAALLGGFYIYGLAAHDIHARQVALGGVQTFLMTALATQAVKHLTHRHRPDQDDPPNPRLWEGPFTGWGYTSFPSGHTSAAFALAAFFSSVYRDRIWVSIVSYGLATGVAWSRIYDRRHWPSDVLIGAALGFAIGKTVFHVMQGRTNLSMGISRDGGVALIYHLN